MAKLPPIRSWIEVVDDGCIAVLATCFAIRMKRTRQGIRPYLRGYSVFFLTDPHKISFNDARWYAHEQIRAWFAEDGYLPYVGPCADLPGWSDYA